MNRGTCPKCGKIIEHTGLENVLLGKPNEPQYKGVSYLCPSCNTVLSVEMDPHAIIEETKNRLLAALKTKLGN